MSFTVQDILNWTSGRLANEAQLGQKLNQIRVERPAPLAASSASDVGFFFAREYQSELPTARPGVLITGEPFVKPLEAAGLPLWSSSAVIACADPYMAMALLSEKFAEKISSVSHLNAAAQTTIHPTAVVHPSAELGVGVQVGPHCVIEEGVQVGAGTVLYPGCYLGQSVRVGERCVLFHNVTLYEWTQMGNGVRVHSGTVLGADGFGYAPKRNGKSVVGHQKIFHLGRVVIGDDVEIGANSCVDRGTIGDTIIGRNAKLDNHVHVGHNCTIGEGAILCGGICFAGNASCGEYAYVAGMTGVINKIHVGAGAIVGAMTLVSKDVAPGSNAVGNPQREYKEHFKLHAMLNRMMKKREGSKE